MSRQLSVGVETIDGELGGGVPAGSLVALQAPPTTGSEMLLHEFSSVRETLYVTTTRSKPAVESAFEAYPRYSGQPVVTAVDPDVGLEDLAGIVGRAHAGANVIIDTVDALETKDPNRYCRFLRKLSAHIRSIDGLAVLHCHDLPDGSPPLGRRLTLGQADATFELHQDVGGDDIEHRLVVTKLRGGPAPTTPISLDLDDRVRVDTTRELA